MQPKVTMCKDKISRIEARAECLTVLIENSIVCIFTAVKTLTEISKDNIQKLIDSPEVNDSNFQEKYKEQLKKRTIYPPEFFLKALKVISRYKKLIRQ